MSTRLPEFYDFVTRTPHTTPTVARLYRPFQPVAYIVIGTEYGHLHSSSGDIRMWRTYSGARRAARAYRPF